jgi:hypothetical protein
MVSGVSCTKIDTGSDNPVPLLKVGEVTTTGSLYNIQFYSRDSLFVGYNKVYFKVTEKVSGKSASGASIFLHPLMNMGTYSHACPFENPGETPNQDGYFEGAVLFSMPGSGKSWSLSAGIIVNGIRDSANFVIEKVIATTPAKKIVVIDSLSNGPGSWIITKYPVSLVEPEKWKVGNNTFEITVHKMASMMSFPCCTNFTVEITPEMPSMGHGSPNNVNPVSTGMGHYSGTVNFTMTGPWRVNMIFRIGDRMIGKKVYFDINV